jgi:hypothetical protein
MPSKKAAQKKNKKDLKRSAKKLSKKTKKVSPKKSVPKKPSLTKAAPKKSATKRSVSTRPAPKKATQKRPAPLVAAAKKTSREKPSSPGTGRRDRGTTAELQLEKKGQGPGTAGQSGDVQGLPDEESVDTESVEELAEEGQGFEAAFVDGVENALDPDEGEVTTKEEPEGDVPSEYLEHE